MAESRTRVLDSLSSASSDRPDDALEGGSSIQPGDTLEGESTVFVILMDIHVTAWPGTPRILAMSLKSVPDFLTDEDHARMDEAVKEAMENWPIVDVLLLGEIVARSEGHLDQKLIM
jgi:hypothetical protein